VERLQGIKTFAEPEFGVRYELLLQSSAADTKIDLAFPTPLCIFAL